MPREIQKTALAVLIFSEVFGNSMTNSGVYLHDTRIRSKGQTISKANCGFLNSPKKQMKLTIPSKEHAQDIEPKGIYNSHSGNGVQAMFTSQCFPAERSTLPKTPLM
jgi:hypothetical protein